VVIVLHSSPVEDLMEQNIGPQERIPRIAMAIAAAVGASSTRSNLLKSAFLALAGGLLSTVATGYCPVSAALGRDTAEKPEWRNLRTWRVETPAT
jgi:hypothetical protein